MIFGRRFPAVAVGLLALISPALMGQGCSQNGCDSVTVAELGPLLAAWRGTGPDCNGDGSVDVRDFSCLLEDLPDFDPPAFDPLETNYQVEVGNTLAFRLSASDPNGGELRFAAIDMMENAVLDPAGGHFRFRPGPDQEGVHLVRFTVSDGLRIDRLTVAIEVTNTGPMVIATIPANDARDVPVNHMTAIRFHEPLSLPGTVVVTRDGGDPVVGTIFLSPSGRTLVFRPESPMPAGTEVRVTVSGAQDLQGNAMPTPHVFGFTTGSITDDEGPHLSFVNPGQGQENVPTNTKISVGFDEPMDPVSITAAGFGLIDNETNQPVAGEITVDPDFRRVTMVPEYPLALARSHTLKVDGDLTDLAGNPLGSDQVITFTTALSRDITAPRWTATNPSHDQSGVPLNTRITLAFDEPLYAGDLSGSITVRVETTQTAVRGSLALEQENRRVVFVPDPDLTANTTYTIEIGEGLRDSAGNPLINPGTSTFTTGDVVDQDAPELVWVDPVWEASDVPVTVRPQLLVSEPVNPMTVNESTVTLHYGETDRTVSCGLQISDNGRRVTLAPDQPLQPGTGYRIYAADVEDFAGQTLLGTSLRTRFTTTNTPDKEPPRLLSLTPAMDANGVPINTRIVARFGESIAAAAFTPEMFTVSTGGVALAGSHLISDDHRRIEFVPETLLEPATEYRIRIHSIRDLAGNEATIVDSLFSTTASGTPDRVRPSVVSISPVTGATNVATSTPIVIRFDEAIDPATVDAHSIPIEVAGTIGYVAGHFEVDGAIVRFVPDPPTTREPPPSARITLTVGDVRDLAGNLSQGFTSWFETSGQTDTIAPSVVAMSPEPESQNLGRQQVVTLFLSESLNASSINTTSFRLLADGQPLPTNLSRSADNKTVTLSASLPPSAVITAVANGNAVDFSGNPLADFAGSFTTAPAIGPATIEVIRQIPANGAVDVSETRSVTLYLSEPLDETTVEGAFFVTESGSVKDGQWSLQGGGHILSFEADSPFAPGTLVRVFLRDGVSGIAGIPVESYQGSFSTAPVIGPETGLRLISRFGLEDGTPSNTVFELSFNKPLDRSTVDLDSIALDSNGISSAPMTFSFRDDDRTVRIQPEDLLDPERTHHLSISRSLRDIDGRRLDRNRTFFFTVGTEIDAKAPDLSYVTPSDGAQDVSANTLIGLDFDELINPISITSETVFLRSADGSLQPYTFTVSGTYVSIQPESPLLADTTYTLTVVGVVDRAGLPLPERSFSFTTAGTVDFVGPSLVGSVPTQDTEDVPLNASIILQIDEPIDPGSMSQINLGWGSRFRVEGVVGQGIGRPLDKMKSNEQLPRRHLLGESGLQLDASTPAADLYPLAGSDPQRFCILRVDIDTSPALLAVKQVAAPGHAASVPVEIAAPGIE